MAPGDADRPVRSKRSSGPHLPRGVIERLARYHQITTRAGEAGQTHVSSADLAKLVGVDATMVRKDMAAASVSGRPKVGYFIGEVITQLSRVLGLERRHDAILIGCGDLGRAIARYPGFARYGLKICGVFDSDHAKVGHAVGEHVILPMEKCRSVIQIFNIKIAILTAPATAAQELADWLVGRGVSAIWNFAPVDLRVPQGVVVRNENLALGLAQFLHQLNRDEEGISAAEA